MSKQRKKTSKKFINRELSWLKFNERVMLEGMNDSLPLLERMKFLSIFSSNLDEFFMIRVAGLMQQRSAGFRKTDPSGMTPVQQLTEISKRVHKLVKQHCSAVLELSDKLKGYDIKLLKRDELSLDQKGYLTSYFNREVFPVLTPINISRPNSDMLLKSQQVNVVVRLGDKNSRPEDIMYISIPVPEAFPRFVNIPTDKGLCLIALEDVIAENIDYFVPVEKVLGISYFRITRDADVEIQEDEASDLLGAVEKAILDRQRSYAVRLEIMSWTDRKITAWLANWLNVKNENIYYINSFVGSKSLMEIALLEGFDDLKVEDWNPQPPRDLFDSQDIWETLQEKDVLLFHPYERFDPVIDLVGQAASDPAVLAIKQTLYRTSSNSPIISSLAKAAKDGKEVTVLVELKARFDEARNTNWARRLEDAGCHVIYGISGLKTHAKALLIVRRQAKGIKRYCHLSTGNYNDSTAKLYTDIGFMTSDTKLAGDVASLFNILTGYSDPAGWSKLIIAPSDLRKRFEDMVEREIKIAATDKPGIIMAKINSLQDAGIIETLYKASKAGVKIKLNVRGICCLKPGVKGLSENIEVYSTIDRYLEHPRIFYFGNGGHEDIYLSSADLMTRNIDKRVETMFPVISKKHKRRIVNILNTYFKDNFKAMRLMSDGNYVPVKKGQKSFRAQEQFYKQAVENSRAAQKTGLKFRPMKKTES